MMPKEPLNRPIGAREGDFSELGDWTITDIATSPKTAPEDRMNAEAEIARREEAGVYNLDEAPQEVRSDLLSHGYGIENGKILYPVPEYKSWLKSDRSKPIPQGIVRESIEDRLKTERQEAAKAREAINAERRRSLDRTTGEAVIQAFENTPLKEKIFHPSRKISEKDRVARERETGKKAFETEIDARRKMKESNKYDNNYLNSEKMAAAETRANLPLSEVIEQSDERVRDLESVEIRADKLYNFYENNFSKNAPRWISFGVSSLLEKGIVDPPTDSLLRSGFWAREEGKIHDRIDPDDNLSAETIDAESSLKIRVSHDLIGENYQNISEDTLKNAKRDGLLYAIYSGARIDNRSGKIIYSIPSEHGNDVIKFMHKNGLDPDSESLQLMSHNGFIGVIEAIKGNKKATEKGFKTLDWYFDTFSYDEHMNELTEAIDEHSEESDQAFRDKFDEYSAYRRELTAWKEREPQREDEILAALAKSEKVAYNELIAYLQTVIPEKDEIELFPLPNINDRKGGRLPETKISFPSSVEKCTKAKAEIDKIRELDPNADYRIGTVFVNSDSGKKTKKQDYVLVRFGYNDFNNVIAIHVGSDSRAVFVWRGKTGDNADAWVEEWTGSSRNRKSDIMSFRCSGYSKKGAAALDDQWDRIWNYLNKPEQEVA